MSKYHTLEKRNSGGYARCFETHKPLPIGDYLIYGGSCSSPMITNADIYVGLDLSMHRTQAMWPWEPGESVLFPIADMGVPKDVEEFKKLIAWLAVQLIALKLVHVGCIGGHGRTGMVLAALVTVMTGEKDSITYVRKNYCEKAVESSTQVHFLHTHFGITEVEGTKSYAGGHAAKEWYSDKPYSAVGTPMNSLPHIPEELPKKKIVAEPTMNPLCIWGKNISFGKPKKRDTIDLIQEGT